jgi:hypothetical protein
LLFAFHAFVFAGSYAFSWLLRFEFDIPLEWIETFRSNFAVVVGLQLAAGMLFGSTAAGGATSASRT